MIVKAYLSVLKLFLLYASKNAFVNRKARKDAFPRAVCEISTINWRSEDTALIWLKT